VLGELGEIIKETIDRTAVEAGPERRFADRRAAGRHHIQVIVGNATDHVAMRFNVTHSRWLDIQKALEYSGAGPVSSLPPGERAGVRASVRLGHRYSVIEK